MGDARAADAGVERMAVTGTSLDESRKAIELCRNGPTGWLIHLRRAPASRQRMGREQRRTMIEMAANPCVRAIGETGLDFNRNYSPPQDQEQAFLQQIELAASSTCRCFCHQRDAHTRFVELLADTGAGSRQYRRALFHRQPRRACWTISNWTAISASPAGSATSAADSSCSSWCR